MSEEIEIKNQAKLSLARVIKLVAVGIKHRLLRSTLTMAVILLAVAFFMSMLTESVFVKATGRAIQKEMTLKKAPAKHLKTLFSLPPKRIFRQDLANATAEELNMISVRTAEDPKVIQLLQQQSKRIMTYYSFFDRMDVGKRLALIGKREGLEVFTPLRSQEQWDEFKKALNPMHSVKIPGSVTEFRGFIQHLDQYLLDFDRVYLAWNEKNRKFKDLGSELMNGLKPQEWLRQASAKEKQAFLSLAIGDGFALSHKDLEEICTYLKDKHLQEDILKALNSPKGRKQWAASFRAKHKLDEKVTLLKDERALEVLVTFKAEDVYRVADQLAYAKHLGDLSDSLHGKTDLTENALLTSRQIFLLAISLMVCMVGIANAMLMSITERFREIATMKCLGATDSFILTQFLIEASIQGLAGGAFGMLIGLALSFVKNYLILGSFMVANLDYAGVCLAGVASLIAGVVLSMLASLYPAWSASRMAPMEAMRIE